MKKSLGLLASVSILLTGSLSACAHSSGYGGGGGSYLDDCGYDGDCYGGPQYTCVINEPVPAPMRMEIALAQRSHTTRTVGPRGDIGPAPSPSSSDGGSSSFTSTSSMPATVSRAPVVVASPSVDRGSPRVPN